jgi:hypothetical protein
MTPERRAKLDALLEKIEDAMIECEDEHPGAARLFAVMLGDHGKAAQLQLAHAILNEAKGPARHN